MKEILIALFCCVLFFSCNDSAGLIGMTENELSKENLYEEALDKSVIVEHGESYLLTRIPGIVVAGKDVLLCYYEARKSGSDWAEIDLLCRRSSDYGQTWNSFSLANHTDEHKTLNNPVMIAGKGNDVFFLYCEDYMINGGALKLRKSSDAGASWSEPEDISYATDVKKHDVFAIGPGHGIYTSNGILAVPCWYVPKGAGMLIMSHHPSNIAILYSADYGTTWHISDDIVIANGIVDPSEASICETSDGSFYKQHTDNQRRIQSYCTGEKYHRLGSCGI